MRLIVISVAKVETMPPVSLCATAVPGSKTCVFVHGARTTGNYSANSWEYSSAGDRGVSETAGVAGKSSNEPA